jgi:hypothetical protein
MLQLRPYLLLRELYIRIWNLKAKICVAGLACSVAGFDSHLRGPSFLLEPPSRLEFSNSSGGWLDCSASGSPPPTVDWLSVDGSPVGDVHGVRRVLRNGTLILLPFPPAAYRQDIHSTVYRCVASNAVGRIISRDVQVRAGTSDSHYTHSLYTHSGSFLV